MGSFILVNGGDEVEDGTGVISSSGVVEFPSRCRVRVGLTYHGTSPSSSCVKEPSVALPACSQYKGRALSLHSFSKRRLHFVFLAVSY
jgi:hypothetical protein